MEELAAASGYHIRIKPLKVQHREPYNCMGKRCYYNTMQTSHPDSPVMRVRKKGVIGWLKQLGGDYRELETRCQHGNILMTALKLTDGVHHRPQRRP